MDIAKRTREGGRYLQILQIAAEFCSRTSGLLSSIASSLFLTLLSLVAEDGWP
jgi:hypothetical protein